MKIDAHQHFWKYSEADYPWISEDLQVIKRDFLPEDLEPVLKENGIEACISIQARQSLLETNWLLDLADEHIFIGGVVGWVDLRAKDIDAQLQQLVDNPKLVGMRHVLQDEPDNNFMLQKDFTKGIKALGKYNMTYDLLILPEQLPAALQLVKMFPNQTFVIDHMAKPNIASGQAEFWLKHIHQFKSLKNVYCKVSGMVTEANWKLWTNDDFKLYLDTVVEIFGTERLMYGSDWPVCLLAAEYREVSGIVKSYFEDFSTTEQNQIFGLNCSQFYLTK